MQTGGSPIPWRTSWHFPRDHRISLADAAALTKAYRDAKVST